MITPDEENCRRSCLTINKENYYLLVGETFFSVTLPRENDPIQSEMRATMETISEEVSRLMRENYEKRTAENKEQILTGSDI